MTYLERLRDYYQRKWSGQEKVSVPKEFQSRFQLRTKLRKSISAPEQNQLRVQMSLNLLGDNCLWLLSTTRYDAILQLLSRPGYSPLLSVKNAHHKTQAKAKVASKRKRSDDLNEESGNQDEDTKRKETTHGTVVTDRICCLPPILQGSKGITRLNYFLRVFLHQDIPSTDQAQVQLREQQKDRSYDVDWGTNESSLVLQQFWVTELQCQTLEAAHTKVDAWIASHAIHNPCVLDCLRSLHPHKTRERLYYIRPHLQAGDLICWRGFHHTKVPPSVKRPEGFPSGGKKQKRSVEQADPQARAGSSHHMSLVGFHHAMRRSALSSDLLAQQWEERLQGPFEFGGGSPASRDVDLELQYGRTQAGYQELLADLSPLQKKWWGAPETEPETPKTPMMAPEEVELVEHAMRDLEEVGWAVVSVPVPASTLRAITDEVLTYMRWLFLQGNGTRSTELSLYAHQLDHRDFLIFEGSEARALDLLGHSKGLCRKGYFTSQSGCGLWNRFGMVNLYGLREWVEVQMHPVLMYLAARLHDCPMEDLFLVPERLRIKRHGEDGLPSHSDRNVLV